MLTNSSYVRVFALDFNRALDTVRHHTLLHKLSTLPLPDEVFNWIEDFFSITAPTADCTRFRGELCDIIEIFVSVIQGSALGLAVYVINAADLRPITDGNDILKYAGDT